MTLAILTQSSLLYNVCKPRQEQHKHLLQGTQQQNALNGDSISFMVTVQYHRFAPVEALTLCLMNHHGSSTNNNCLKDN